MKKGIISVSFFALVITSVVLSAEDKDKKVEKNYSNPYMLGVAMSRNLTEYQFTKEEISDIIKGFTDGINKKVTKEVVDYDKVNGFVNQKKEINTTKRKKEGTEYLNNMAKEPNAKKLDSGIVMKVENEGQGEIPKPTDKVKVNYKGYFINGKTFDSSYDRGQPVEFVLNQVIPCWTQSLTNVKVGSKVKLGCPSDMAYGDKGLEPVIPGGSTLLFDIELISIVKEEPKKEEIKKEEVSKGSN